MSGGLLEESYGTGAKVSVPRRKESRLNGLAFVGADGVCCGVCGGVKCENGTSVVALPKGKKPSGGS